MLNRNSGVICKSTPVFVLILLLHLSTIGKERHGVFFFGLGSQGGSVGMVQQLSEKARLKMGLSFFPLQYSGVLASSGRDYDVDFDLFLCNIPFYFDVHPLSDFFWFNLGLFGSFNSLDIALTPTNPRQFGDITLTPEDQGTLETAISFNYFSPYLGMGFGSLSSESSFQFFVDIGVMYQGFPEVTRRATGMLAGSAEVSDDFEKILRKHRYLTFYPVLSAGFIIRPRKKYE